MPDPTAGGGNDAAQVIAASLTGVATILGALVLWPTRRRRDRAAAAVADVDPEDRPAMLRERIRALETRADAVDQRLGHHDEEITLLRAQEITAEGFAPRPPRRRGRE